VPGDYVVKERACVGLAKEIEAMPAHAGRKKRDATKKLDALKVSFE
jgi:hypothetical protein